MIRRLAVVGSAVGALGICPAAEAAVQDPVPIGPNESFVGLVNGASSDAVIDVACPSPIVAGDEGHPLAGQTTEVELAPATTAVPGFTGSADTIDASYTYPSSTLSVLLATFGNYFVPAPVSTSLEFPCAGTGTIAFTPVDGGPQARPWDTKVTFESPSVSSLQR